MKPFLSLLIILNLFGPALAAEKTATFSIPDMTCALCPLTVKKAIGGVDGVKSVKAELATKTAIAIFEDSKTTPEALTKASADAGYPASLVSVQ